MANQRIMTNMCHKLLSHQLFLKREFQTSKLCCSYEAEGKTTVTVLNKNFDYGLMIDNVSEQGFILNNGIRTVGPMIIFPKTMLSWNIASSLHMSEESFTLLTNLEPKLDILIIGLDDEYPYNAPFILNLKDFFKKHRIKTEIQPVFRACSTFNFLNSENRYAAAALIPPKLKLVKDLIVKNDLKKKLMYKKSTDPTIISSKNSNSINANSKFQQVNSESLSKDQDIQESLKIRSPWKPENRPVNKQKTFPSDKKNKS